MLTHQHGGGVTRIDVGQPVLDPVVLRHEEGDEALALRNSVHTLVQLRHEVVQALPFTDQGVKIGLEVGHQQGRTDALTRKVTDAEHQLPIEEFTVVEVVAAHPQFRSVDRAEFVKIVGRQVLRDEHSLYLRPQVQVRLQAFLLQLPLEEPLVFDGHRNHVADRGDDLHPLEHILLIHETADEDVGDRPFLMQHRHHVHEVPKQRVVRPVNQPRSLDLGQVRPVVDFPVEVQPVQPNRGG